jgi:hypothetical protein
VKFGIPGPAFHDWTILPPAPADVSSAWLESRDPLGRLQPERSSLGWPSPSLQKCVSVCVCVRGGRGKVCAVQLASGILQCALIPVARSELARRASSSCTCGARHAGLAQTLDGNLLLIVVREQADSALLYHKGGVSRAPAILLCFFNI